MPQPLVAAVRAKHDDAREDRLLDVVRCLPLEAQLLHPRECIAKAIISCCYLVSQLTECLNIFVQPVYYGLAIRQANISIHLGITGGQARHVTESC